MVVNTENNKTNEPHRFKLDLTDKLKACVHHFLSNFYFSPKRYSHFCISVFPSFFLCQQLL